MENSFFIFTDGEVIEIERFHICTWEFKNSKPLIEFGAEISKDSIKDKDSLCLYIYIPWLTDECEISDLYTNLSISKNSRFIFNDSIEHIDSLDGGDNELGVIYTFKERNEKLCILPITHQKDNCIISINIPLNKYNNFKGEKSNIYFRFLIENFKNISTPKPGIGKSTIIYDVKINEQRNIPDNPAFSKDTSYCKIKNCFLFNIIPNKYDIVFFESASLKSIRALEVASFKTYLPKIKGIEKDDLIVVFNKKKEPESYTFFSIYSKEVVGMGQFSLAILINVFCGFLLTLPSYRKALTEEQNPLMIWEWFTWELYLVSFLFLLCLWLLRNSLKEILKIIRKKMKCK